jgi:myo-inositol-1-phosphate synthase
MNIRVAIIGCGNCASSLVQGTEFYRRASPDQVLGGVMHPKIGGYGIGDIQIVAAFDVAENKVGKDLAKALVAEPNNTARFCDIPNTGVRVVRGPTGDGIGEQLSEIIRESTKSAEDVVDVLRYAGAEVVVSYLPVGSERISRWYAKQALEANCAFINCIPVYIAKDPDIAQSFAAAKLPLIGDDVKSQVGATIVHRALATLMEQRGVTINHTYQLNFGGNADFKNLMERSRLGTKKESKTQAVLSQIVGGLAPENIHIGPSDFVPWLGDRKWAYIRLEGTTFGNLPLNMELKLEVWDSPNSAGVVVDLIRCAKLALERGQGGVLDQVAAYYMKSPPLQCSDDAAFDLLANFIMDC